MQLVGFRSGNLSQEMKQFSEKAKPEVESDLKQSAKL